MKRNYHTHTFLCNHAEGTMEEYVIKAIEGGLTTLGFSDHVPYVYPNNFSGPNAMEPSEVGIYFDTLLALREKYSDKIKIHIGFEAEYYPALLGDTLALLRSYPVEYFIYGGHAIGDYGLLGGFNSFEASSDERRLAAYVDAGIAAIRTGRYSAIAHPDCINFVGSESIYRTEMRRFALAAKEAGLPLEVNMHGLRCGRHYPNPIFWEEVSELGAEVFFGMDCHLVKHVAVAAEMDNAEDFARRYSLKVVDELKLINPTF